MQISSSHDADLLNLKNILKKMSDILVIIPLHKFDDDVKPLLNDAVNSVPAEIDIVVSASNAIVKDVTEALKDKKNVKVSGNDATDFPTLVNSAVSDDYKWFSILEYDDEYTPIWFNNVKTYIEFKPETSVFLPLEDLVDFNTKEYAGIGNEAPWASSFSNEIGVIDLDCLQNFFEFYLTGSVFNTADWKELGGLKTNIPVYFWYEFLLRLTNKGKGVFVIPKVGYAHYLGRKDSLLEIYRATISDEEARYWMNVAKKEYFFIKQREVAPYSKEEVKKD